MSHLILVLGSTGRVGRALRAVWPVDVPVIWQSRQHVDAANTITWDLRGPAPDLPALAGVVVLAGVTAGPDLAQNTAIAQVAAGLGPRVLLTSTQAVYGTPDTPVTEDDPVSPSTPYGQAKLAMEQAMADQPHVTCLRLANVVGCDGLAGAMMRGPVALDQFADGQGPQRMMITPQCLAHVICTLIRHPDPLPPVMNVAQPGLVAMQAVLTAAGAAWHWRPAPSGALARLEMDVTLLQRYLPACTAQP